VLGVAHTDRSGDAKAKIQFRSVCHPDSDSFDREIVRPAQ